MLSMVIAMARFGARGRAGVRMRATSLSAVLFSLALSLAACGGGGSGGDNPTVTPPAGSSNWDQMKWDQDNWG